MCSGLCLIGVNSIAHSSLRTLYHDGGSMKSCCLNPLCDHKQLALD